MANETTIEKQNLHLEDISDHYRDVIAALYRYYRLPDGISRNEVRFKGYSINQLHDEMTRRIREVEMSSSFSLFGAIEAKFRLDCQCRVENRDDEIEPLSTEIIRLYDVFHEDLSFHELLSAWLTHYCCNDETTEAIKACRDALLYRNWLSHGRYRTLKGSSRSANFDFDKLFAMAEVIFSEVPLQE